MHEHKQPTHLVINRAKSSRLILATIRTKILGLHNTTIFQLRCINIYIQTALEAACLCRRFKIHTTSGETVKQSEEQRRSKGKEASASVVVSVQTTYLLGSHKFITNVQKYSWNSGASSSIVPSLCVPPFCLSFLLPNCFWLSGHC